MDGKLPALGQALAAASVPVILPSATVTTLTPPAAITGFATSAKQDTEITSLQLIDDIVLAEDAAHSSGDKGIQGLTVRQDTAAALAGTDGDYQPQITDASGRTHVNVGVSALPTGAATAAKQPALGTAGTASADVITVQGKAAMTPILTDASATTQPVSGTVTANMGTVTADPFGANADAASATGSISAKLRFIAGTGIPITGTVTVGSHAVTNAGTFAVQAVDAGDVAHDGADSGNPVKVGGKATNVEPTAVSASGDRTNFITDMVGKQITLPYSNPENLVSGVITSAMTGTTSTSLVAAPAAGLRNYITQITVSNAHATVGTDLVLQDGSGGTTLYNIPAAAVYGGATLTLPAAIRQPTTATAIYIANVTTGASTKASASGYKGV